MNYWRALSKLIKWKNSSFGLSWTLTAAFLPFSPSLAHPIPSTPILLLRAFGLLLPSQLQELQGWLLTALLIVILMLRTPGHAIEFYLRRGYPLPSRPISLFEPFLISFCSSQINPLCLLLSPIIILLIISYSFIKVLLSMPLYLRRYSAICSSLCLDCYDGLFFLDSSFNRCCCLYFYYCKKILSMLYQITNLI